MKSIVVACSRVWLLASLAILCAAVILAIVCIKNIISPQLEQPDEITQTGAVLKKVPIYSVETPDKKVALTFDCAWENSDTQILLDILGQNQIPATFFATGDWCERYPEDVKAFAADGHAVENHSYGHPHVASISEEKLTADTLRCDDIIEQLTGVRPTLYRAPYGEYSDAMLQVFEEKLGHKVIQWDCDSRDWQGRAAADMVTSVLEKVGPGSIILFHNDTENTPNALRQLIPELKGQGYDFVLVKDLIYQDNYTLDHQGRQILNTAKN